MAIQRTGSRQRLSVLSKLREIGRNGRSPSPGAVEAQGARDGVTDIGIQSALTRLNRLVKWGRRGDPPPSPRSERVRMKWPGMRRSSSWSLSKSSQPGQVF